MSESTLATDKPAAGVVALVDAFSLFFKAFYAIRGLTNDKGMPTNGLYGFVRIMQKMLDEQKPDYVIVALDSPGPSFRSAIYPEYKANRPEPPADLVEQIPWIVKILHAWKMAHVSLPGYEADDLIGALARRAEQGGMGALIVSADKDLFQLVTGRVKFLRMMADDMSIYGPKEIHERLGVWPGQVADYLALVGDSSDNIPGAAKIGPKTAVQLLEQFPDLDTLYGNLDRVENKRWRTLLEESSETVRLSRRLTEVDCDAPVSASWEDMRWHGRKINDELAALFMELGFSSLAPAAESQPAAPPVEGQSDYATIYTADALESYVARIAEGSMLAVDTETTSTDPMRAALVGISLSAGAGQAAYVPVGHRTEGEARQLDLETVKRILGPALANPNVPKTGHNIKYDWKVLLWAGLPVEGVAFDTDIAAYLLDPGEGHGLKELTRRHLGIEQTPITALIGSGKNQIGMDETPIEAAAQYASQDADFSLRLASLLGDELKKSNLEALNRELELPLIPVLAYMEMEGIRLDVDCLRALKRRMGSEQGRLAGEIYGAAGCAFNINSTKQVAEILFDKFGLKPVKTGKTGYSTDLSVLQKLAAEHPLPALLLEFRANEKLLSTYIDPLPEMLHPETGRLHCSFSQTIAATGRLSCHNPNLQNIPVRSEQGREIRRAFLPNREGEWLLAADYSQIELRILAHLSGDEELRGAFRRGEDIHRATAARIFGGMPELIDAELRGRAKAVNFGIVYGMSAARLATDLRISRKDAAQFIDDYFAAYPRVKGWIESVLDEGRRTGRVRTMKGRIRRVPDLNSRSVQARRAAERIAVNTPVQGTAADMIKLAMIAVDRRLRRERRKTRMLLQIHDELIFTVPEDEIDDIRALVGEEMAGALPLDVPIQVDIAVGKNWAEAK